MRRRLRFWYDEFFSVYEELKGTNDEAHRTRIGNGVS
jgi:hypothetical protein